MLAIIVIQNKQYHEHLSNVYYLISANNQTDYMTQDACVRILHYTIPHKPYEYIQKSDGSGVTIPVCPECANVLRQMDMFKEPGLWITEKEYQQLIERSK